MVGSSIRFPQARNKRQPLARCHSRTWSHSPSPETLQSVLAPNRTGLSDPWSLTPKSPPQQVAPSHFPRSAGALDPTPETRPAADPNACPTPRDLSIQSGFQGGPRAHPGGSRPQLRVSGPVRVRTVKREGDNFPVTWFYFCFPGATGPLSSPLDRNGPGWPV